MGNYVSDKKNARFFGLKLSRNTDADLIERLESVNNVQNYLKALIRDDISRHCPDIDDMIEASAAAEEE